MKTEQKTAAEMHEKVPPGWYFQSIKNNILQRYWHQRRFTEVGKLIEPTGGKILDLGSADGVFSKVILDKSNAQELVGLDVLKSSVDWANRHWQGAKMKFFVGDVEDIKFPANSFDAVFALEVLEHVFDPVKVLAGIKRVMKKGGYGIFLVPTDSHLFCLVWWLVLKFWGRIWKDTHIQSFRNDYLPKLCKKTGFNIEVDKKFLLGMLQVVKVRK